MSDEILNKDFSSLLHIIDNARNRALKTVNTELIRMYWDVGEYLSDLCENSSFGDKVIDEVAKYISTVSPTLKGFNRRGYAGNTAQFTVYALLEYYSVIVPKNQHSYISMRTDCLYTLPKNLTAQSAHLNYVVLPVECVNSMKRIKTMNLCQHC